MILRDPRLDDAAGVAVLVTELGAAHAFYLGMGYEQTGVRLTKKYLVAVSY